MGQEDGAVRTKQLVQPAIGPAGFDHGAERCQLFDGLDDRRGVFAGNGDRFHSLASVVHSRQHNRCTVQIDSNMPLMALLVRWTVVELHTSNLVHRQGAFARRL